MNDNFKDESLEKEISYKQLLNVFLRRKLWLISTFSVVLGSAVVLTLFQKPLYQSQMQLLLEPTSPELQEENPDQKQPQFSRSKFEIDYATQLTLMQSEELINEVVERISQEYPEIDAGQIQSNFVITQVVQNNVNTRVFEATYANEDPEKAREVLETIQKIYVEYNLERRRQRLNQGLDFINNDIEAARETLTQTEDNLEQFREDHNLIEPTSRAQELTQNLDRIEAERLQIESQYSELRSQYQSLQSQLNLSPELTKVYFKLSESPRYQALLDQLQKTELAIADERAKFTFETPNLANLQERYQQEIDLLREEINAILREDPNVSAETVLREAQRLGTKEREFLAQLIEMRINMLGLEARRRTLQQNETLLRNEINELLSLTGDFKKLQPEVQIQRDKIKRLLETKEQLSLELEREGFNWEIIQAPQTGKQISPSFKKNIAIGIVLGLFLGGTVAFLREAVDDTINTVNDLEGKIDRALLGNIPDLGKKASLKDIINSQLFQESIYLILQSLKLDPNSHIKSLAVSSIEPLEGKSTTALGLALVAASRGKRVLLIDANLRRPNLHKMLNIPNKEGLSNLVLSKSNRIPQPNVISILNNPIEVITAGDKVPNPIQVFSARKMKDIMREFEKKYDAIVLDLPPIYGMVDTIEASSLCDGLIMVGRLEYLTKSKLTEALSTVNKLDNLLGWVVNGVKVSKQKTPEY